MSLEVDITNIVPGFKKHLDYEYNKRIIFSGAFGSGKTYFLHKFFEENLSDYLAVQLAPINYSISSNEDIFQLIKFDILYELITNHGLKFNDEEADREIAYNLEVNKHGVGLLEKLFSFLPLLNKDVPDITSVMALVPIIYSKIEEIERTRKDLNLNSKVNDFFKMIDGLYNFEQDFITQFIESGLSDVAKNKKKVLVIDDLDRIDPEHIFRLFNIFSSHMNYTKSDTNKFGFDKIVFVCDIYNIRNIFHSKYGSNVDFSGYIDKFYSTEVYHFDNKENINNIVDTFIDTIKISERYINYFHVTSGIFPSDEYNHTAIATAILNELVHSGILTLRRIISMQNTEFPFEFRKLNLTIANKEIKNWQVPIVSALEFLSWILGGAEVLERALIKLNDLEKSSHYYNNYTDLDWLIGSVLVLLDYKNHQFVTDAAANTIKYDTDDDDAILYNLVRYADRRLFYAEIHTVNGAHFNDQDLNFYSLLYKAFLILYKRGYLQ